MVRCIAKASALLRCACVLAAEQLLQVVEGIAKIGAPICVPSRVSRRGARGRSDTGCLLGLLHEEGACVVHAAVDCSTE